MHSYVTIYNVFIKYYIIVLISSYGTPLDQRASYLPLHSSPDSIVNYDYR